MCKRTLQDVPIYCDQARLPTMTDDSLAMQVKRLLSPGSPAGVRATAERLLACAGKLVAYDAHMNLLLRDITEDYTVRLRTERTKVVGRATAGNQASGSDESAESGTVLLPDCTLHPWQETGLCAAHRE